MAWPKLLWVQLVGCALIVSANAEARPTELLKRMCFREEKLRHLAVACYILGRGRKWDCHPVYLRRTSLRELRAGHRLRQLPTECRAQIAHELERRRYLMTAQEETPVPSLSDLLIDKGPNLWQEN